MRVAIRPSFYPGGSGGIEQYVQGLVGALSDLDDGETYDFVGTAAQRAALAPFVRDPDAWVVEADRWVDVPMPLSLRLRHSLGQTRFGDVARRARAALDVKGRTPDIPRSPAHIEEVPYDVVHFPDQGGERTRHRSIYQPWDLQHLHFPEYFSRRTLAFRAVMWPECCRHAAIVLVASEFVRDDVAERFDIDPSRIAVVPPGAPLTPIRSAPRRSRPYLLFPAQAWRHKNHVRLIDAIAALRARGTDVRVVLTGQPNVRDRDLRAHAATRRVEDLVEFAGYLSSADLSKRYSEALGLVFPSEFEGFGFPVLEAFAAGVPVACSGTTSLPELAGGAALLFEPTDVDSIADAVETLWTDETRRSSLIAAGAERAALYSWDHLARSSRALYRAIAEVDLEPEDEVLLARAGVGG